MSNNWRQPERGNPFFLYLLYLIVRYLGRGTGRALLYPTVVYFYLTSPHAIAASREFLGQVCGHGVRAREIFHHLLCFATTLLDRLLLFGGRYPALDVRVHCSRELKERMTRQSCLLIVSHLGSFDVLRVLGQERGELPLRIVMDRRPGAKLEALLRRLDPNMTDNIIDGSQGKLRCILKIREALARGEKVGIMADRAEPGGRSVTCDFLGKPARFPLTPWLLAGILGVPVILGFGLYRGGKRYDLYLELLSEQISYRRAAREAEAGRWAQRYAWRLADYAREAPENWFNFYPFWQEDSGNEADSDDLVPNRRQ
jgi:predicted LPLAT superfamily acyltransferase